jgi:Fis family transcriptional regulator, factor for inversion stimulation protein
MSLERVLGENVVSNVSSQKKTIAKKTLVPASRTCPIGIKNKPLCMLTDEAVRAYFKQLNGHKPGDLYQLVLGEVERPLFSAVMQYTNGNQSEAAEILGINRGTLRKKLKSYKIAAE